MAIAGHVSKKMLEHYSRIRTDTQRAALKVRKSARRAPGELDREKVATLDGWPVVAIKSMARLICSAIC
jgi:hypothetical protein